MKRVSLALLTLTLPLFAAAQLSLFGGGSMAMAYVDRGPGSSGLWGATLGLRYGHAVGRVIWAHDLSALHAQYRLDTESRAPREHHIALRVASGPRFRFGGDWEHLRATVQAFGGWSLAVEDQPYGIGEPLAGLQGGFGLEGTRWGMEILYGQSVLNATPDLPRATYPAFATWQVSYRLTSTP